MATNYGLRVINDSNAVQIDQDYRNYVLLNKVTLTTGTAAAAGVPALAAWSTTWATYTVSTKQSILAFKSDYALGICYSTEANGTFTYKIAAVAGNISFTLYEFGPAPASTDGYGLRVWNGSGQVTFDSNYHYMRVLGYLNYPDSDSVIDSITTPTKVFSGAPNIAFAPAFPSAVYDSFQDTDKTWENSISLYVYKNVATGLYRWLETVWSVTQSNSGNGLSVYHDTTIVIDTTGL